MRINRQEVVKTCFMLLATDCIWVDFIAILLSQVLLYLRHSVAYVIVRPTRISQWQCPSGIRRRNFPTGIHQCQFLPGMRLKMFPSDICQESEAVTLLHNSEAVYLDIHLRKFPSGMLQRQ